MDGMIRFDGLLGVFVLLATVALLLLIAVIASFGFFSEIKNPNLKSSLGWSRHFLLSALILLLFDGMFILFLQRKPTFKDSEANFFDERMLFIWIPSHIVAFLLIAYTSRLIRKNKLEINRYIDKFR